MISRKERIALPTATGKLVSMAWTLDIASDPTFQRHALLTYTVANAGGVTDGWFWDSKPVCAEKTTR